jgi:hypothetical protein
VSSYAVAQPQNVSAPQEKTAETISLQRQRSNQTEPAVLHERIFDEGCKTFAEPRFGYDFSLVPARTDMMRQAQPLLSTRTMVQRYPVNGDTESIPCAICSDEESTSSSASAESAVETASPSPEATPTPASAEPEEESVTSEETATPEETAAPALIVEDSVTELSAGQMRKSEFIIQLRAAVTSTAESAMAGTGRTTADCPYLEYWFGYYSLRSAQHGESALRRYAPEASRATSAREYISIVTGRVRRSVETWVRTGEVTGVPEGIPTELPGAGLLERIGSVFFKAREGGARRPNDPRAIQSQLGRGQPLNSGVRSRMESAFGRDFSQVRTHTDTTAAGLSDRLNARAFTVGEHVAFGSGEYKPGTLFGDALIAHEMAHVVQQSSASDSLAPMQTGDTGYNTLEKDADRSAMGAVASLWAGAKDGLSDITQNIMPRLRSSLRLSRCSRAELTYSTVFPKKNLGCGGFKWAVKWGLTGADASTNGFIVQKLTFDLKREKCAGGRNDFAKTYWEGWQVRKGKIYIGMSKSLHRSDTFQVPPTPDQKGVNLEEGHAKYMDGYTAPLSWGHVPEALSLPATTTKPAEWSDSGTIHRWLRNEFDCCAGKTKSNLTSKG